MRIRTSSTMHLALAIIMLLLAGASRADTTYVNTALVPTGTISGHVLLDGQPTHAGSMVYVAGTNMVAATDISGAFTIIGVPYGSYTLNATHGGFAPDSATGVSITLAGQQATISTLTLLPGQDETERRFGRAMMLYSYDDFSGAIDSLQAMAVGGGSFAPVALYRTALAFSQLNQPDSAIATLGSLIADYPGDALVPDAYYWRGVYRDDQLDFAGALGDFQTVINSYPASTIAGRAQYRIGREYEALMNYPQAIAAYLAVEQNYPTSLDVPDAIFNVAWLYYTSDQFTSAIAQYDNLLNNHPTTQQAAKASFYKAMCYFNQEQMGQALTQFNASISSYPTGAKVVDAYYYRALCKVNLEAYTYAQAKADFQYVVTTFPSSDRAPHARYYLGTCEYNAGNYSAAISAYQAYMAAEPGNDWVPNAMYRVANAFYFGLADYAGAATAFVDYYNAYPDGKQAGEGHYWAGRCYERLGLDAQAISEYCTVIVDYPNCSQVDNAVSRRDGLGATTCP